MKAYQTKAEALAACELAAEAGVLPEGAEIPPGANLTGGHIASKDCFCNPIVIDRGAFTQVIHREKQ